MAAKLQTSSATPRKPAAPGGSTRLRPCTGVLAARPLWHFPRPPRRSDPIAVLPRGLPATRPAIKSAALNSRPGTINKQVAGRRAPALQRRLLTTGQLPPGLEPGQPPARAPAPGGVGGSKQGHPSSPAQHPGTDPSLEYLPPRPAAGAGQRMHSPGPSQGQGQGLPA